MLTDHCRHLLDQEERIFLEDYARHFIPGESKHPDLGRPYLLHNPQAKVGVLLIHGFMAVPQEMRELAEMLHARGYTVYVPRLPGHGTSPDDLKLRRWQEWSQTIRRGHAILKDCHASVVVAGFSTGAGLALRAASQHPQDYDGVISISAPLRLRKNGTRLVEPIMAWNLAARRMGLKQWHFVPNKTEHPQTNYLRIPLPTTAQLKSLMRQVKKDLPKIEIPALIIQAKNDPTVHTNSAHRIYDKINVLHKRIIEIEANIHGIVRGDWVHGVFGEMDLFLSLVAQRV